MHADAFPERSFAGHVQTLANRAEFTPRNVQTQKDRQNLVFAVTVRVPNPDGALKAGPAGRRHVRPSHDRTRLVDRPQRVHPDPPRPAHAGDRAGHAADAVDPVRLRHQHHRRPHRRPSCSTRRATRRAARFVATFFNTGYFDLVDQVGSLEQVRQAIDAGSARVGIVVPPDFSHDLRRRPRAASAAGHRRLRSRTPPRRRCWSAGTLGQRGGESPSTCGRWCSTTRACRASTS